jgi:hypothetical protein
VRDFLSRDKEQNLKVVTAGIKVLERMAGKGKGSKADDEYRLVQVRYSTVLCSSHSYKMCVVVLYSMLGHLSALYRLPSLILRHSRVNGMLFHFCYRTALPLLCHTSLRVK